MQRRWFHDTKTDTYYRNCPVIHKEAGEAGARGDFDLAMKLHQEWKEVWPEGLVRKTTLDPGDVVVTAAPFREAYPHLPALWWLDEE